MSITRPIPYLALTLGLLGLPVLSTGDAGVQDAVGSGRLMAVTVDDVPRSGPTRGLDRIQVMNRRLIDGLVRRGIPAVGFLNEGKLGVEGERREREALLKAWVDAGLELRNHTYSHPDLNQTPLEDFQRDVVNGEPSTRPIPHVLLLHANELNADRLDDLVDLLEARGYRFGTLKEVLTDPVYDRQDVYTGPSWLFRWDYSGDRVVDWRSEPVPPDWVMAYDDYRP